MGRSQFVFTNNLWFVTLNRTSANISFESLITHNAHNLLSEKNVLCRKPFSSFHISARVVPLRVSPCRQIAHLRFTFVIHHELVGAVRQKYSASAPATVS